MTRRSALFSAAVGLLVALGMMPNSSCFAFADCERCISFQIGQPLSASYPPEYQYLPQELKDLIHDVLDAAASDAFDEMPFCGDGPFYASGDASGTYGGVLIESEVNIVFDPDGYLMVNLGVWYNSSPVWGGWMDYEGDPIPDVEGVYTWDLNPVGADPQQWPEHIFLVVTCE